MRENINYDRKAYKTRRKESDPASWRPVKTMAEVPTAGVKPGDNGNFKKVMEDNIAYLLNSFSVDHMLYPFRLRAGMENPPKGDTQVKFWDTDLWGANAGRFLMGAANTLKWMEHLQLREMMDDLIDGIEACSEPDGYFYPWHPEDMLFGKPGTKWAQAQQSNYARPWLTHGLIEAHAAGNRKALNILRRGHDWFNRCEYLPHLTKVIVWPQGYIASTRIYFTPLGKAEDLQIAEKYYVSDEWLERAAQRDDTAIWVDGHGYPHCYLITVLEAYLDHYLATGTELYLEASKGCWEMFKKYWQLPGGIITLCEGDVYPPGSNFTHPIKRTGENCSGTFWTKFNQRFHRLFPEREEYVAEIEKSIWNVSIANQDTESGGIRYSARVEGEKQQGSIENTCCEGQGTRALGSLPEYIYSVAEDGMYVNLFEDSSIDFCVKEQQVNLKMSTRFPYDKKVEIIVETERPIQMKIRIRIPSWATDDMLIDVNGLDSVYGKPGTYQVLEREWKTGDRIRFVLPMGLGVTKYKGMNNHIYTTLCGYDRYGFEYGLLLLAVVFPKPASITSQSNPEEGFTFNVDITDYAVIRNNPDKVSEWLVQDESKPLHFTVKDHPEYKVKPYFELKNDEFFTCFPVIIND